MNSHVHRFYRKFADEQAPIRLYHEVISLHEMSKFSWEELSKKAPFLPKGWYELAHLNIVDRIDFIRDYWLSTLPYVPHVYAFLEQFFNKLDDVGVFLTQLHFDTIFESEMVYSLKDGSCFYHGFPPCSQKEMMQLKIDFEAILPEDFLAFLEIHDGFSKHSDTGVIQSKSLKTTYKQFQNEMRRCHPPCILGKKAIDPIDLIPFYESFGQGNYQCFLVSSTSPDQVGNLYCAPTENRLSDIQDGKSRKDHLVFSTFLDWLIFYLESLT